MARRISAHTPSHRLATRAWTGGHSLASNGPTGSYYPSLSSVKIADQDVEMHAGREPITISGSLEGKPLTMRRRFQRHPPRIPLHRRPAEQPGPEGGQAPRIRSVQHNLAYPPDHRIVAAGHQPIIPASPRPTRESGHPRSPLWAALYAATRGYTISVSGPLISKACPSRTGR
jgi:hypothetical protein